MNWPENYKIINDTLVADISIKENETDSNIILLNKDPRKQRSLPDCYAGDVLEIGTRCKLVKVGDKVTFTRWQYSQSDLDEKRIALREVDLVIVNDRCVNGYIAVKLYEPWKKEEKIIQVKKHYEQPKNYWGQVIDIDRSMKNTDTDEVVDGDIILFQHLDDYQFRIGNHTMVFKNLPSVVILKLEAA